MNRKDLHTPFNILVKAWMIIYNIKPNSLLICKKNIPKGTKINLFLSELYSKSFNKDTMRKISLIIAFILLSITSAMQAQTATSLISQMLDAIHNFKSGRYILNKIERMDGKMYTAEMIIKLQTNPLKVYSYNVNPDPGAEALFLYGSNNNDILVRPNKFPYVNLNLSPFNSLVRKNHHHTIYEIGFGYIGAIISYNILNRKEDFYAGLTYDGEVDWKGKKYFKITIDNKDFAFIDYKVEKGENLYTIGKKFMVADYMILSNNKNISDYDDIKAGQTIKIPNCFAKKIEFYLDKDTYLPVIEVIYDHKGLFAQYEFNSLLLNVVIKPEEFTPKYKDYKF